MFLIDIKRHQTGCSRILFMQIFQTGQTRFVVGVIATFFCYACTELINQLELDDALDVWGVHGMGGFIGAILSPSRRR